MIFDDNSLAIIVDIQEKLMPSIYEHGKLTKNVEILIQGLKLFDIPFLACEQYPKGLGTTIDEVKSKLTTQNFIQKTKFSCFANETSKQQIVSLGKKNVIVFGIEAHICVLQTCLDLLENGFCVFVVVDCCGSRKNLDKNIAMQRLSQAGAILTSYESLLFEICKSSKHEKFKELSKLIK